MSSSCNFLQPRGAEARGLSDTLSEVSDNTTNSGWTSAWDSREDLRDLASKLGLRDSSELFKEKFRVDRKTLELMLAGDSDSLLPAEVFFEQIMQVTNTCVSWPSRLKVGAKSKKDPYVRIAGREEDVTTAKQKIQSVLDTRSNRVTLKMDVSYTDHSHIIGRGGANVRRIMEETKCHVHFPDSNRCNRNEKSNQVSVAGDLKDAELARSRIRQMTPVTFGFDLPVMSESADLTGQFVQNLQERYGVQVFTRNRPKLHSIVVMVKGVEWEVEQAKKATILLMEYLCQHLAKQIPVHMTMEISPFHHPMVVGRHHCNIKDIMMATGAQILFPDAEDPNIPALKKSNVTLTGPINSVFTARQYLTGCLPLMVMFDLPDNPSGYAPEFVAEIQNKYNVVITIRMKSKQHSFMCTIKGPERHATNIYKARNEILKITDASVLADIPESYHLCKELLTPTPLSVPSPAMVAPIWHYPAAANSMQQTPLESQLSSLFQCQQQPRVLIQQQQQQQQQLLQQQQQSANMTGNRTQFTTMSSGYQSMSDGPSASHMDFAEEARKDNSHNSTLSSIYSDAEDGVYPFNKDAEDRQSVGEPSTSLANLEQKRKAAYLAMQKRPIPGQIRYPNGTWSGYGFSQSFSSSSSDFPQVSSPSMSEFNNSNVTEEVRGHYGELVKGNDLETLFTSIGLEKYIGFFNSIEVDLNCFLTLTERDLRELQIDSYGARRKMVLAIKEMNRRKTFNAAPGAERNSTSSSGSPQKW